VARLSCLTSSLFLIEFASFDSWGLSLLILLLPILRLLACLLASILGGGTFAALVAPVRLCFASYPSIDFATSVMVVENINARWVIPVNFA
jgi:hypothetical protein